MSDIVTTQKLAVLDTVKEGFSIGIKNIGSILVNVLLWALTVLIPYLNVGTTIGLTVGIVSKASRGEVIPLTEIFDPKYRKYMGEYFLTYGFIGIGVTVGTLFFLIPGIVISLAWSLAILLVVDKGKNPTEAITLSNNLTYGYKKKIFGIYLLIGAAFFIVTFLLGFIGGTILGSVSGDNSMYFFTMLLTILMGFFVVFVSIGLQASIYKQLTRDI